MYKTAQKHRLNRTQKSSQIEELSGILLKSKAVIIASYGGLSVAQLTELRRGLLKYESKFKVVKNKLLEMSAKKSSLESLKNFSRGNIGIIFCNNEEKIQELLKYIKDFSKQFEKFSIVGGFLYNTILDKKQIVALSDLPSKQELLSNVVYLLNSPLRKLGLVLKNPLVGLLNILRTKSKKD